MNDAPLLTLEQAQARLLALVTPLPIERSDVSSALGRYLAEPLVAHRTQPAADMSAMDGFAVAADDLVGPWTVIGESAAGRPFDGIVQPGKAVRISTGAMMPAAGGVVLLQEDTRREGSHLVLAGPQPVPADRYVRRRGLDFGEGAMLLAPGTRLGPLQAALAIAAGHRHVAVHARPRVTVLDSGDELCAHDVACGAHQIPASNGLMLAAMASATSCDVRRAGPVPDDLDLLARALDDARDADVIVTSGGASVGDHDLIRPALTAWGAEIAFWRVAIKPGKPLLVATRQRPQGQQIVVGLPGNPASSCVTAYMFLLPLLRALCGASEPLPFPIRSRLMVALPAGGRRREFLRARWDGSTITPIPLQDSGALTSLAASNALIDRPVDAPVAAVGEEVSAYLLHHDGMA